MDFEEYRRELNKLYDGFVRLHQQEGGEMPKRLPGIPRSYYLKLIIDVTQSPDEIYRDIEEFRNNVFETRKNMMSYSEFCGMSVVTDLPRRSDGKRSKISPENILKKTREALIAHENKEQHKLEIAKRIGIIEDTHLSDQKAKNVERRVSRCLSHAQTLLTAISEGSFFQAVETPFDRNK